jgi:DNA polymerase-1
MTAKSFKNQEFSGKPDERSATIVDGSGFVYRAFYASPEISSNDGMPVGAVYSFCSILISLLGKHFSELFCIMFDAGRQTFRSKLYSAYKANRTSIPDELRQQIPLMQSACVAFGIPTIKMDGFEADDLIATYSHRLSQNGYTVKIISNDKDLTQLIDENVYMFDPVKKKEIKFEDVFEKFGVSPSEMIYFQALVGDACDNIPGAKGIGPVAAARLIEKYHTIDNMYENIGEILPIGVRQKLEASKSEVDISLKLVTLDKNVELEAPSDNCLDININISKKKAVEYLSNLGFYELIARLDKLLDKFESEHVVN